MLFDVLIIVVIAIFATFGFINGFAMSIAKVGGWILAFIVAFFIHGKVEAWLIDNTEWFDKLSDHVFEVCSEFVEKYTSGVTESLPDQIEAPLQMVSDEVVIKASDKISTSSFSVFVFVGIIAIIVILISVLAFILSNRDGIMGGIDGISGLLFGLVQGAVAVVILLALLVPIAHVVSPEVYGFVTITMEESYFARIIYENNPLLFFIGGVLPSDIDPLKWIDIGHLADGGFELKDWGHLL